MSILLLIVGTAVALMLGGLVYSAGKRRPSTRKNGERSEDLSLSCNHVANLSQLRQALDSADLKYVRDHLDPRSARRLRRERNHIARTYLQALQEDFARLMRSAQLVAKLSPRVEAHQEWRRFRLNAEFQLKYRLLQAKFALGINQFPSLGNLAVLVSSLAIDLERTVNELGAASLLAREQTLPGR